MRMKLDDLRNMFDHIAECYSDSPKRMDFVWHGGEPLLIEPQYYEKIGEIQHEAFDKMDIPFTNSIQTNLSVINDEIIDLFQNFFQYVGVSIDLFGDQRLNLAGKSSQEPVLRNMQNLIDNKINFGCITVLSKFTAPHVDEIYCFFEDIDTSFRFLPIYRTGYESQQDNLALSDEEIVSSFKKVVDHWFASDSYIQVRPIQDYVANVVCRLDGGAGPRHYYDKNKNEVLYIVDTDGSLYSNADAYNPKLCHGNIFRTSLPMIVKSATHLHAIELANQRMDSVCPECRYYGVCSGFFMAEATPEQRYVDDLGHLKCGIALPVQRYIEDLLIKSGLVDTNSDVLLADKIRSRLKERKEDGMFDG